VTRASDGVSGRLCRVLPRFEVVARRRPVDLVSPSAIVVDEPLVPGCSYTTPHPAPYAAVCATFPSPVAAALPNGRLTLELTGAGGTRLAGWYDAARGTVGLDVTIAGRIGTHRSRRHGRAGAGTDALGLTLTGTHLTVFTREGSTWVARGRTDLAGRLDTRDEAWLGSLHSGVAPDPEVAAGLVPAGRLTAGGFGQLGLRDIRVVSHADGTPYLHDGRPLLTATSAGPGFFDTGHTSVWSLDPAGLELTHRADLFFRRPDRPGAFGDNATHLVRDDDRWLVATSTWGDFDAAGPDATVAATLAETDADLLSGRHLLDTRPLPLPADGLRSVGVWDPHLVRTDGRWRVGYVSATRFFRFHPVLAEGPSLDALALRGAAADRVATEGTTLIELDGTWRLLASDGRDGRRAHRKRFPVFDLDLVEVGALDAPYPTNIPWPTLLRDGDGWLLVTFNAAGHGGDLVGYGTHGAVVLMRAPAATP
jgi:hypothetical protein